MNLHNCEMRTKHDLMLECNCGGSHYLTASFWDNAGEKLYILSFIGEPSINLWTLIKYWWKHRNLSVAEMCLDDEDLGFLIDRLISLREKGLKEKV